MSVFSPLSEILLAAVFVILCQFLHGSFLGGSNRRDRLALPLKAQNIFVHSLAQVLEESDLTYSFCFFSLYDSVLEWVAPAASS